MHVGSTIKSNRKRKYLIIKRFVNIRKLDIHFKYSLNSIGIEIKWLVFEVDVKHLKYKTKKTTVY